MTPPGLSQRSRATSTGASMFSSTPMTPSHSETITSTGSGRIAVSAASSMIRTRPEKPLAATTRRASAAAPGARSTA